MTTGSELVRTIEDLWRQAQKLHPEIPDAVIGMTSGTAGYSRPRWGHVLAHAFGDDVVGAEGNQHHYMIAGECFADGAERVLANLLHEAAHLVATSRGVQDCASNGRHNKKFKTIGEELGLIVQDAGRQFGWTITSLAEGTKDLYNLSEVAEFGILWRKKLGGESGQGNNPFNPHKVPEGETRKKKASRTLLKFSCACDIVVYMTAKNAEKQTLECSSCGDLIKEQT